MGRNPYISRKALQTELRKGASGVSPRDVEELSGRSEDVRKRFKRLKGDFVRRGIEEFKLLMSLIRDYATGKYRQVPWRVISVAAFALLYFLNPLDLVPDYIPGIGYIDDITLLGMAVSSIRHELDRYKGFTSEEG